MTELYSKMTGLRQKMKSYTEMPNTNAWGHFPNNLQKNSQITYSPISDNLIQYSKGGFTAMTKNTKHRWRPALLIFLLCSCLCIGFFFTQFYPGTKKEPETIYILLQRNAENCQDFNLVEQELNQYLAKTEDYQVQFRVQNYSALYNDFMQNLKSAEPIDILFGTAKSMKEAVAQNLLEPLDSLLQEQGNGICEVLNKDYLNTGYIDGTRYGLPSVRDYSYSSCFEYDVQLARQYDLQMDSVKTMDDLEKQLLKLKESAPSIIPVGINLYVGIDSLLKMDFLGDNFMAPLAVLRNYGQTSQIVNFYETQEFTSFTNKMYAWRKEGLLMDDTGASISAINYLKTHKVFGCFSHYHPGFDVEETRGSGTEIACVVLSNHYISSFNANNLFWEIPAKSQHKEAAMRFLKRMYTDENVIRILAYGKEGVHYEYKDPEHKTIGYPEGINVDNSRYSQFLGWMYGNEMLMPVWEGLPEDLWQQITDYNDTSIRSIAIGFSFDETPVANEFLRCTAVAKQYYSGLTTGQLNPAKYLPILRQELSAAGIGTVISEKQRQLNEYLKGEDNS